MLKKIFIFKYLLIGQLLIIPLLYGISSTARNQTYNSSIYNSSNINQIPNISEIKKKFLKFTNQKIKVFSRTTVGVINKKSIDKIKKNDVNVEEKVNIKILLNVQIPKASSSMSEDVKYYKTENQKYLNQIIELLANNNINVISKYFSKLSPTVWIKIKSGDELNASKLIEKLEFVSLIINNIKNRNTNSSLLPKKSSLNYSLRYNKTHNFGTSDVFFGKIKEIVNNDKTPFYPKSNLKVGVVEANMSGIYNSDDYRKGKIRSENIKFYNIGKAAQNKKTANQNDHATLVSSIIAGADGFVPNTKLVVANLNRIDFDSPLWMSVFEKLIIEENVRIINHSYGFSKISTGEIDRNHYDIFNNANDLIKKSVAQYYDLVYYLDFLSRKYGVINVFAAGNEYDKHKSNTNDNSKSYGYISGYANALNSIVVGSTFGDSKNFYASDFSNRLAVNAMNGLPKPMISAPGENIIGFIGQENPGSGTSFSTPIVTGLIAKLINNNSELSEPRKIIPQIMSIITSSANDSELNFYKIKGFIESTKKSNKEKNIKSSIDNYLEKYAKKIYLENYENERELKSSGLDSAVGAGQIDYKKMEKALSNLVTFSISYNKNPDVRRVYVGSEFKIKKGEKFKASLAWAFNAGIIEGWKKLAKESNWLGNIFAVVLTKALWEYAANEYEQKLLKEGTNKNDNKFEHEWLRKKELFEKQENLLFTDYDLILEKKIDGNRWEEVDLNSGRSSRSNVELVRYKPNSDGVYRLVIKKYKSSLFEESIDDDLAVSYVIS